jgi:hypothetical protein
MLLRNLDGSLHKAVEELKIVILSKFGKENGRAYFSEFGIVKIKGGFRLPADRNQKMQAVDTLIKGMEKYALAPVEYPLSFFKETKAQYDALMQEAQNIDGTVASEVGAKNEAIKQVEKVLSSIVLLLKANYPDTYKAELRSWGFQKEKY